MMTIELKNPTVADVIKALENMPQDAPVKADDGTGYLTENLIVRYDVCTDEEVEIIGN